jgi:hypothetical protein
MRSKLYVFRIAVHELLQKIYECVLHADIVVRWRTTAGERGARRHVACAALASLVS